MTGETRDVWKSVRQLLSLAIILVVGYLCIKMFRFSSRSLNFAFVWVYLLIPFLAIRPMRQLSKPFRVLGSLLLAPILLFSSGSLLVSVLDALYPGLKRVEPLQTIQQGPSTVELIRYEHGGAVGPHSIYLEQRRLIVPGLYLVKIVGAFSFAHEATLSVEAPYKVRLHARGSYDDPSLQIDAVYSLKPWVYF